MISASRVVLAVVKRKFDKRLAIVDPQPVLDKSVRGCPFLDGSMEPYSFCPSPELDLPVSVRMYVLI